MDSDDFSLLHPPALMHILLRLAARSTTLEACLAELDRELALAQETPPASRADKLRLLGRARLMAAKAGLIAPSGEAGPNAHPETRPDDGSTQPFRLTDRGRQVLRDNPMGVDETVLMVFPEFAAFVRASSSDRPLEFAAEAQYDMGFAAFRSGAMPAENPFSFDTIEHLAWENGWFEARDEFEDER